MTASEDERRATAQRLANWGNEAGPAFAEARDPARLATAVVTLHRRVDEVLGHQYRGPG